jgi:hypothetical protein
MGCIDKLEHKNMSVLGHHQNNVLCSLYLNSSTYIFKPLDN